MITGDSYSQNHVTLDILYYITINHKLLQSEPSILGMIQSVNITVMPVISIFANSLQGHL